jgi:hypothetical protein
MRRKKRNMKTNLKGGVSMLHIIINKGVVGQVIQFFDDPNQAGIILQEEFDYKVEYLEDYEIMDKEG